MAESALFIGWGNPVRGREQKALEVFNEVVQFFGQRQQQGDLTGFEPVALEPHGGDLQGFFLLRGDREQLNRLRYSPEFQRIIDRGQVVVESLGVVSAFVGEELQQLYGNYQTNTADITGR